MAKYSINDIVVFAWSTGEASAARISQITDDCHGYCVVGDKATALPEARRGQPAYNFGVDVLSGTWVAEEGILRLANDAEIQRLLSDERTLATMIERGNRLMQALDEGEQEARKFQD